MTPRTQLILAIAALCAFTGLAITMLCLGQPANAIASLILAIVLGVTQLVQALNGLTIDRDSRRPVSTPTPTVKAPAQMESAENTSDTTSGAAGTATDDDDERPAA
ncbi:hypothetical protein ACF08O_31680 [Streptomyces paradoxus]|uniref:hypothetical protein n=1 Tax=Streptomyces paradoxus TaxID=66375 RepID=UPI0036F64646